MPRWVQILIMASVNLPAAGATIGVIHDVFPVPHLVLRLLPDAYLFIWLAPIVGSFWMGARRARQFHLASWMLVSFPWAAGIAYSLWASFDPGQSCGWSGSWREYYLTFAGGRV